MRAWCSPTTRCAYEPRLGALAEETARQLMDGKALQRVGALLADVAGGGADLWAQHPVQSGRVRRHREEVFSETLLDKLMRVVRESTNEPAVQAAGLDALGNLSFEAANRRAVSRYARDMLSGYAPLGRGASPPSRADAWCTAFRTFRTHERHERVVASRVASRKTRELQETKPRSRNEKKKPPRGPRSEARGDARWRFWARTSSCARPPDGGGYRVAACACSAWTAAAYAA